MGANAFKFFPALLLVEMSATVPIKGKFHEKNTFKPVACKWAETPAESGYPAGCAEHFKGKCAFYHPGEPGYKGAVQPSRGVKWMKYNGPAVSRNTLNWRKGNNKPRGYVSLHKRLPNEMNAKEVVVNEKEANWTGSVLRANNIPANEQWGEIQLRINKNKSRNNRKSRKTRKSRKSRKNQKN